jgi:hypothetical protein
VSKEAQRLALARRKQRNARIAKSTVVGACVVIMPLLFYLAIRV